MSNPTWPMGLPKLPMLGYKVKRSPNVVTNETASGPPEVRRRSTKARATHATPVEFNGTQKDTFDVFFITTLRDGTLDFDMLDMSYSGTPRNAVYNFMGEYPEFANVTQGTPARRLHQGQIVLEYKGLA